MKKTTENPVYHHDTLEFVTVAVRFCAYLEDLDGTDKKQFLDTMLKILPLLYLKANMLPKVESDGAFMPDDKVTEQDYDFIRNQIYVIMGCDDDYEDLCWDEDIQTEESRWKSISEDLADIYQAVRNFVAAYQQGVEECMKESLWAIEDNFDLYWGGNLVDALRQMHRVSHNKKTIDDEDTAE